MEEIDYCFECKTNTDVVLDFASGDRICTQCGLVLDIKHIDENAEGRTFADDNNNKKDPNRVGSLMNPFLTNRNLVTVVSEPKNSDRSTEVLHSKKLNNKKPDDILVKGFDDMASMADRLGLVAIIKNRAYEIYKNVEEHKSCRGRTLDAIFAACLLCACREIKLSLPQNHFANAANGAKRKEINKVVEFIKKQLEVEMGAVNAGEFVRRFCSNLEMSNTCMMAVQEAVAKAEEFDIRRSPSLFWQQLFT